jgi:uncharacterized membrane protein YdjX (TVP38/TMEM64 family)
MTVGDMDHGDRARSVMRLAGVISLIVATALVGHASGATAMTARDLREWVQGFSRFAPLVFICLFAVLNTLGLPLPVLGVVGGATFGLLEGAVVTLSAMTVTACVQFLLARHLGGERLRKRWAPGSAESLSSWSDAERSPWPAVGSCLARSAS